jgi:hypothetical protein
MIELEPRRDSMRIMMIAVAAALALGTATMATGAMAFGCGGGHFGGGGGGHFGGGAGHFGGGGRLAAVSGAVILATTLLPAVSVAVTSAEVFRGGFGGMYGFGGASPYYGYGHGSCYASCPTATLGLQLKLDGVL